MSLSASASAVVWRSGRGACSRNMDEPLRGRLRVQPAGTAWSPLRGVVGFGTDMWGRCSRPAFADNNPSRLPAIPAPRRALHRLCVDPRPPGVRNRYKVGEGRRSRSQAGATMGGVADPRIGLSEPTVGEEEALAAARAVRDGHLVFGPDLPAFEAAL